MSNQELQQNQSQELVLLQEEYRPINHPDNPGHYSVSNFGNIKNMNKGNYKTLGPNGTITFNTKKQYSVGRLVAMTFLSGNIDFNKKKIFHKDGNKLNNHISNLYWK